VAQRGAGRIPSVPHDDRARRRRFGGDALQSADSLPRQLGDSQPYLRGRRDDRVVGVYVDPCHARRLDRPVRAREPGPECDRHLAKDVTGKALANHPLDAIDDPDHLDAARKDGEERAFVAFVDSELARE
jgi:hypothetical protein